MWGCGGSFTPEDYANDYRHFTTWLPGYGVPLYMIACGPSGDDIEWTENFFRQYECASKTQLNGWAPHYYCGAAGGAIDFTEAEWYELLRKANRMERLILNQWHTMEEFNPRGEVKLIVDEWGAWHPSGTEINPLHTFEQISTMRDALIAALTLDTFNRHCDKVFMANIAQMVNNLHSLFLADGDKFVATPNFHVFDIYAPHKGADALRTDFSAHEVEGLPGIAGSASMRENLITLTVTNLHAADSVEAEISIKGAQVQEARQTILSHDDIHANNTFEHPEEVVPKTSEVSLQGNSFKFAFPPASIVRLDLAIS